MKLTELKDPHVTWAEIGEYHQRTTRREGVHLVTMFFQEAEPHREQFTPLAFYLWCFVRTNGFTSREWAQNWDAGHLGGNYQTSRQGIREAAKEFAKFDDTAQLQEEEAMLKEFEDLKAFALEENPRAQEPIVAPPPKPIPLPPLPTPEPQKPEEPQKPDEPSKWKLPWWAKATIPFLAGFLAGSLDKLLDAWIGPGEWDTIIKGIISALTGG